MAHLLHLRTDPTAAALWSAALWGKNRTQLDDRDGQGGTACPFDSLASLFNDPTNIFANTCIIPDRANESGCYIPEAGMEMVARQCFEINPSPKNHPVRDGAWLHSKWKESQN
jgi:hypothetical protein